jgi:hypothetical protein
MITEIGKVSAETLGTQKVLNSPREPINGQKEFV